MRAMVKALQQTSVKDTAMKCDVMFLWGDDARPSVIKEIPVEPEIDEVEYVARALIWRIDRRYVTRSRQMNLLGTSLYKRMTIRNRSTTRKSLELPQT